nr:zinc finger C2H2-type/integrase DNA-binding domain-containing protein [Tanacetum cinerariifolium]
MVKMLLHPLSKFESIIQKRYCINDGLDEITRSYTASLCFLARGNNIVEQNLHDGQWESERACNYDNCLYWKRFEGEETHGTSNNGGFFSSKLELSMNCYLITSKLAKSSVLSQKSMKLQKGAIYLMMISRGVRSLDELKLVFSRQLEFAFSDCEYFGTYENNDEFEVLANESIGYGSFVNESELGLKKDLTVGYGPIQLKMNLVGSCDQDFRDRDGTGSRILLELKRRYKHHVCAICYKKFGSAQALGSHKRVHNKVENKISGVNSSDVEFKQSWVIGSIANGTHLLW